MKYFLISIILLSTQLKAQTELNFDKRFVQSEDKWVAFKLDSDDDYGFGFIYIDAEAGLTMNYEGTFEIMSSGEYVPTRIDSTNMKVRLEASTAAVAFIPASKFQELKIQEIPEWLEAYKTDLNSIERLYKWGFMYNGWNECEKALSFLEKAEKIDPEFKGLAVELAFSYNCLIRYDEAEKILEEEIKKHPGNAYINKEYIYTLAKNNRIDKAINQFETSLKSVEDRQYNAENCYAILYYYYYQGDKENFDKWYKVLRKHPTVNGMITQYAESLNGEMKKR